VEDREQIRRAFHIEKKSRRQIERDLGHDRRTMAPRTATFNKALANAEPGPYKTSAPRASPVLGQWRERIQALWNENKDLPRKQRLTAKRIFELIQAEGYSGSEQSVRRHVRLRYKADQAPPIFLKLEYDPGKDAQFDWGEAMAPQRAT